MRQAVRPPAVALHETRWRLRFCPPEKAVGATRHVDIRQDVVVHQHAALRHATRHRAVIDVDGNGRLFAIPSPIKTELASEKERVDRVTAELAGERVAHRDELAARASRACMGLRALGWFLRN